MVRLSVLLAVVAALAVTALAGCPPPQGFFPPDVPRDKNKGPCAADVPDGTCDTGQTCRAGQCLDDTLFCSTDNPTGVCPSTADGCLDGACTPLADQCSDANTSGLCSAVGGLTCHDGVCATANACAPAEPLGFCDAGLACVDGACVDRALLCATGNPTGVCRTGFTCVDGTCADDANLCSPSQPAGLCASGKDCVGGACHTPDELCSATNVNGACELGFACLDGTCVDSSQVCGCTGAQTCVDGVCRDPGQLCSASNPNGVCGNGQSCIAGVCQDLGAACSPQNPVGVCPPGQLCDQGACTAVDGAALCNDNNACTTDTFDPVRNRCRNDARSGGTCDDGNACTTDTCNAAGTCVGAAVGGCIAPPNVDPVVSPTNVGSLTLTGTKPAGASVDINALEAVPENPDTTWTVNINLVPGDNRFVIDSVDGATTSAAREIHVVYDITAPVTRVTPDGGSFLTGVTATIASNEPATVLFTTDGGDPTDTSESFTSLKQLRVYADTHLRLRARDLAGNLEAQIVDVQFEISARGTSWAAGPRLAEGVSLAGAATTGDRVFVVGGTDGLAPQAGAFSYSVAADAFTTLPSLSGARDSLVLVALGSSVYAIGGENAGTPLNRVELLDDGAAAWVIKQPMPTTRHSLGAVVLDAGAGPRIYAFGGKSNGGSVLSGVEVYDPAANSWSNAVAQMPHPRAAFGAVVIDGEAYLVGGEDGGGAPVAALDIYNPATDTWRLGAPMPEPRTRLAVTVVDNQGTIKSGPKGILAAGGKGVGGTDSATVEEYVIDDDAWHERTPLPAARHSAAAVTVVVPGDADALEGQGWLVGGQEGAAIVATTRAGRTVRDYVARMPDLPAPRFLEAAAALDDRVYVFGGRNFSEETQGWAFDPETGVYEDLPALPSFQNGLSAAAVGDRVYAIGGADSFGNSVPTMRAFDPADHAWVELHPMTSARRDVAVAVLGTDVYVIGGDNGGALPTVEIYDTVADQWRAGPLLPSPRTGALAVAHGGKIHVVGGESGSGTAVGAVLRLDGTSWTVLSGSIPVSFGAAFALQGRIAVFGGRNVGTIGNGIVEYDVGAQQVVTGRIGAQIVTPAVDRFAAALHNGRIYFFGGNANATPGPQGTAVADELDARCFDGVVDGREVAGGPTGADNGGGCPQSGFLHHTGVNGEIFANGTPSNVTSLQGALDACNAHFGAAVCERVDCNSTCGEVARPDGTGQSCSCGLTSPSWTFSPNQVCLINAAAGTVMGPACTVAVGNWD